jgi:hypothetical protein
MSKGLSSQEAFSFAMRCKELGLLKEINIIFPDEASCENCLYNSKCDAPIITDNRINASNCGSFINVKDVIIKADILSKLSSTTWYSRNGEGYFHEGATNNNEAFYKYNDILRLLGIESETHE